MPVFNIDQDTPQRETRPLIILNNAGLNAGFLVDRILDVAEYRGLTKRGSDSSDAICESVIINGRATDVVNTHKLTSCGIKIEKGVLEHA